MKGSHSHAYVMVGIMLFAGVSVSLATFTALLYAAVLEDAYGKLEDPRRREEDEDE